MVIIATVATVIASQAVITGAYSLTRQAVQLGLLPRMEIRHTSEHHSGQIFLPRVNLFLMIGVMLLVVLFGSSSKLASAYGISVTGTMVVTTVLAAVVVWRTWNVRLWIAILLVAPFLIIELTFLSANLLKVLEGGWVPLLFGVIMVIAMLIWVRGTNLLYERQRRTEVQMSELPRILAEREIARVPGTAIFLTTDPATVPASMIQNLKHNKVLHEQNVILTIDNLQQPYVVENDRVEISSILQGVLLLRMRYGYAETPNVLKALAHCRQLGWKFDIMQTTFFLSRRALRPDANSGMPLWQDRIFIVMARNADTASDFFRLPVDHVMEVGTQVKI
jgi:KUP system potassium uptake protein